MVHPEVAEILRPLRNPVARAILEDGRRDLAVVVLAGREGLTLPELVPGQPGVSWTLMPRVDALALGRAHTLECGELLSEPLGAAEAWVLVLGPEGAAAVPLVWQAPAAAAPS